MMMKKTGIVVLTACAVFSVQAASWLTFGGTPQRDGWARAETELCVANVGALKLGWKTQLDNAVKEMNSLTAPLVVEKLLSPRGFNDAVIVAGASDTLFAVDADTGKLLWQTKFSAEGKSRFADSFLCPNALNATPVVEGRSNAKTVYAVSSDGKLHAVNAVNGEERMPPLPFVPPYSKPWSLNLVDGVVYTVLSQGCNGARSAIYAMDMKDPKHPVKSFQVASGGGGIWGRAGAAISRDGVIYVETGDGPSDANAGNYANSFVAVSARDMKLVDYYTPANYRFIDHKDLDMGCISPLIFPFGGRTLVAGAGKEGVLYLLDGKSLGGADHQTPLLRSLRYTNEEVNLAGRGFWGALASWEDKSARWIYAPAWGPQASGTPEFSTTYGPTPDGSIMAFRVIEKEGKPVLEPVWRSRNLQVPEPPIVANGVVYALSNGENVQSIHESGRLLTSAERIAMHKGNAVLYALDAATGKELYSSGAAIPGFAHMSGLAIANGHVFVTTFDNTVYSFTTVLP